MATRDATWWCARLAEWKLRPYPGLPFVRDGMIAAAEDFITRFHAEATVHGWQPAHLLHPRGLAYRWWAMETAPPVIAWEPRVMRFSARTVECVLRAELNGAVAVDHMRVKAAA